MFIEEAVKTCYQSITAQSVLYQLGKDFPAFKGHFEGHPLLPAVCHISFCRDAAGRLLNRSVEIKAIKKAKFINPVLPGSSVEVKLSPRPEGWYFAELIEPHHHKKLSQMIVRFSEKTL